MLQVPLIQKGGKYLPFVFFYFISFAYYFRSDAPTSGLLPLLSRSQLDPKSPLLLRHPRRLSGCLEIRKKERENFFSFSPRVFACLGKPVFLTGRWLTTHGRQGRREPHLETWYRCHRFSLRKKKWEKVPQRLFRRLPPMLNWIMSEYILTDLSLLLVTRGQNFLKKAFISSVKFYGKKDVS